MKTRYFNSYLLALSVLVLLVSSCSKDDSLESDPFVVAFESLSKNIMEVENEETIRLVYSETAIEDGYVTIEINPQDAVYGVDFTTIPEAAGNRIILPIVSGDVETTILFKKLTTAFEETTEIKFSINSIGYDNSNIQGNKDFVISASPSLGGSFNPEVGGPNEGNQVYIDLSNQKTTLVQRDSWDLGFYNGDEFRVTLNGSVYMATKSLAVYDIDAVTEASVASLQPEVAVGTFDPSNEDYIDATDGDILETAIRQISANDEQNPVYLVNLGYSVGTGTPNVGSVEIAGEHRGWKKIRILRDGDNYILQYADLNSTTHQEVTIPRIGGYNFNHFSFNANQIVNVEPEKDKWDMCFTVFTNVTFTTAGESAGSYGFSDFVIHNRKGGALVYKVNASDFEYDDFRLTNINESSFLQDQRIIGDSWRDVFSGSVSSNHFYVLKDPNGNIYKLKFLALTNSDGVRGHPEFKYELLQ
ncbi:HmuY family protein [uncultured Flavobacterium sp.]|uniref:HmuY family protein n=1 Tax=uncultured Flavobacterium sp. TaxID=165435 RepID=UPI0025DDFB20|nr:HmuY family protein [uncultured Flavobacterium sp.]